MNDNTLLIIFLTIGAAASLSLAIIIVAGCFSTSGAQNVEAQEIIGEVAYGTAIVGNKTYKAIIVS